MFHLWKPIPLMELAPLPSPNGGISIWGWPAGAHPGGSGPQMLVLSAGFHSSLGGGVPGELLPVSFALLLHGGGGVLALRGWWHKRC